MDAVAGHRLPDVPIAYLVGCVALAFNGGMARPSSSSAGAVPTESSLNDLMIAIGQRRDRAAFAAVFDFFAPRIKSYLMRGGCDSGTAEEVVQEVMVTIWRRAEQFDPSQASAGTWVFTIARNKRIDMLRRERRPEFDPSDPVLVAESATAADESVEASQEAERLRVAMRTLPEEQKDLLSMAFFEDKPHSTIAEERNLPLGTVKSRIRLALARLRKELREA